MRFFFAARLRDAERPGALGARRARHAPVIVAFMTRGVVYYRCSLFHALRYRLPIFTRRHFHTPLRRRRLPLRHFDFACLFRLAPLPPLYATCHITYDGYYATQRKEIRFVHYSECGARASRARVCDDHAIIRQTFIDHAAA